MPLALLTFSSSYFLPPDEDKGCQPVLRYDLSGSSYPGILVHTILKSLLRQ